MEYNELVSVVMPVHNGEKFLKEAIESVLNQTYRNFEFIIVENCSTDSSVKIIQSYKDPRIRLIIEEDCGQVQAYNRGFKEAKGEYIFIHDHDDISNERRFELQLETILNNGIDICGTHYYLIDEYGSEIGEIKPPEYDNEIRDTLLYKNFAMFNSTVCLKKKIIERDYFFNPNYFPSADYEFYLRVRSDFRFQNVPQSLYSWRQHKKQISSSFKEKITKTTVEISLLNCKNFPKEMKNTYTALVYYYNNKLLISAQYLLYAIIGDKLSSLWLRYLLIVLFGGVFIKIFRKFSFEHSKIFIKMKSIVDKIIYT